MKLAALSLLPLLLLASCRAPTLPPPSEADPRTGITEAAIFRQINAYRSSNGLPRLSYSFQMAQLARTHSENMTRQHSERNLSISHKGFKSRARAAQELGMTNVAENVAAVQLYGAPAAPRLVQGWIESKGHHKNIIGNYNTTGVGVHVTQDGAVYATQLFGKTE